jgi:pyridoxamine 5'-phosphate oxidase
MSIDGAFSSDPWTWFRDAFARAQASEPFDASRAALATADERGWPSVRFVLVKQIDERGFAFFTNASSMKGRQLAVQPHAALAFHWASTGDQVRVEGAIEELSASEADAYFATRPRGSQISAWASDQSAPIADRASLVARYHDVERRFANTQHIPRPPGWLGYRVRPSRIEFWHDQADRLHDRWSFTRDGDAWRVERLQP